MHEFVYKNWLRSWSAGHFAMAGSSVLDKVYLPLIRYLNVNSVKPYLKQKQLLTDDELERLDLACNQSSQNAAETLIKILKRKGPNHEGHFLSALKESMLVDPHQGHLDIISALEEVVEEGMSLLSSN